MNKAAKVSFRCREDNDLYQTFVSCGFDAKRGECLETLVQEAEMGIGILVLADSYPYLDTEISSDVLKRVEEKQLNLYVEYPKQLAGLKFGAPTPTVAERVIVSDRFFDKLPYGSILMANDAFFLPVEHVEKPHLLIGKAAGYDTLAFDLPKEVHPALFQQGENIMIATTCLSKFITGRFSPAKSWTALWEELFFWLTGSAVRPQLSYELTVRASYGKEDSLPRSYEMDTAKRSYNWFKDFMVAQEEHGVGTFEGFMSKIEFNGHQRVHNVMRCDCIMESSLVFALESVVNHNPKAGVIFRELLDYGFSDEFFNNDKTSSEYGFLNWFKNKKTFYGDDNARALLAAMCARSVTGETAWDEKILKCILANLRTSNDKGFKETVLTSGDFKDEKDWRYYYHLEQDFPPRPHFQCYVWATFLWAYELTGYKEFLEKAKSGLKISVEGFPDTWQWTNSLTAEIARLILPLSFLVKVEDTQEHRSWLKTMTDALAKQLVDCGAVLDMFGDVSKGTYPPPQSNEAYGTTEASLIQNNGDPATDLLYTTNWAFLGLHEAANATGDPELKRAEDKLAEFLCRIQIRSEKHPNLDGAWMRSFDFDKWEYFGSSADRDWGAWCVETGWTNAWIASVLYLRKLNRPLMTDEAKENFRKIAPPILQEMMTE